MFSYPVKDNVVEDERSSDYGKQEIYFVVGKGNSFYLSVGLDFELVVRLW